MITRNIINRGLSIALFTALVLPWIYSAVYSELPNGPQKNAPSLETAAIAAAIESKATLPTRVKPSNLTEAIAYVGPSISDFTAEEDTCLAQAIYFEARSEPLEGQLAVAQVVLNRVNHKRYPDTVCGVVFQNEHLHNRCQFSFACDGRSDRPREMRAWKMAQKVSLVAKNGYLSDITHRATHYHADYVSPYWRDALEPTVQHGRHHFYRIASSRPTT